MGVVVGGIKLEWGVVGGIKLEWGSSEEYN